MITTQDVSKYSYAVSTPNTPRVLDSTPRCLPSPSVPLLRPLSLCQSLLTPFVLVKMCMTCSGAIELTYSRIIDDATCGVSLTSSAINLIPDF